MKKLMLFLILLTSHSLKPGCWDIFWNSNCTLEDLSPHESQRELSEKEENKYDAPSEEADLFGPLFYTVSCQWYRDIEADLKQCTSGDDGYVCAGCTGTTACCCLYGCVHCPEVGVPAVLVMSGAYGVHKIKEKCFAKYGLKKDK